MEFCARCSHKPLCSKGLYTNVRLVLDMKDCYYLAAEYMYCAKCNGTFIAWDHGMLQQLGDGPRTLFPAVLTRKYTCDRSVLSFLRARTLSNSPTALCHNIHEARSQEWMSRQLSYLSDCQLQKQKVIICIFSTTDINYLFKITCSISTNQGKNFLCPATSPSSPVLSGSWQCMSRTYCQGWQFT